MGFYSIYYHDNAIENKRLKIFYDHINIYGLIVGPVIFLFYGMWKEFFIYTFFLFANALLFSSGITTVEFYWLFYVVIFFYIAIDFFNRYEQHLL